VSPPTDRRKDKIHIEAYCNKTQQENPAIAREDALQPIQFLLQYWLSRSYRPMSLTISDQ